MINFYETPIPGIGVSFSNLITNQAGYLAILISARSIQDPQRSLNTPWMPTSSTTPGRWCLLYGVHAVMMLVTFTVGVLVVPSLTSSIFSGRSGESVVPGRVAGF